MKTSHSVNILNENKNNAGSKPIKGIEFPQPLQKKTVVQNKFKKNWLIYQLFTRKVLFS